MKIAGGVLAAIFVALLITAIVERIECEPLFSARCGYALWRNIGDGLTLRWVNSWETLLGGALAIMGAGLGAVYLHRQITQQEEHERRRRDRKLAAVRATLPLTLDVMCDYAQDCARKLDQTRARCTGAIFLAGTPVPKFDEPPIEAISALGLFVESTDDNNSALIEDLLIGTQIMAARIRTLTNRPPSLSITTRNIDTYLLNAAAVYARAEAAFPYARRQAQSLPETVTWEQVRSALSHIGISSSAPVNLLIDQLSEKSTGPQRFATK